MLLPGLLVLLQHVQLEILAEIVHIDGGGWEWYHKGLCRLWDRGSMAHKGQGPCFTYCITGTGEQVSPCRLWKRGRVVKWKMSNAKPGHHFMPAMVPCVALEYIPILSVIL